jgi:hypothetical protein
VAAPCVSSPLSSAPHPKILGETLGEAVGNAPLEGTRLVGDLVGREGQGPVRWFAESWMFSAGLSSLGTITMMDRKRGRGLTTL